MKNFADDHGVIVFQFQHGTIKSRLAANTNMPKIRMIAKGEERFFD